MDTPARIEPNAWATVFGYEDIVAERPDGTEFPVRVRQIRARQAPFLLGIIEDEYAALEYVCIQPDGNPLPEGWIDTLHFKSHREIVKKVREVNFPVLLDLMESQVETAEEMRKMTPFLDRVKALQSSLTNAVSPSEEAMTKS